MNPIKLVPTWREAAVLLALTAVGLALRLTGLDHESIWFDEAASLVLARADVTDLLTGRVADDGNPAGYFVLLHGWLHLLGGASIANARALSAVAGGLGVPAVWLLARSCGLSRGVGLLAAGLVAVSPPLVYLGQEARVFALFATVATLAAAAAARAQRGGGALAWAGFAASGAVLVHLHYYAAFVLAALGLQLLLWAWRRDRRGVVKLAICTAVVLVAFAPWLPTFRWQLTRGASRSEDTWWQHLALLPLYSTAGRTLVWKDAGLRAVAAVDLTLAALVFAPLAVLLVRNKPGVAAQAPDRCAGRGPLLALVVGVPLLAAGVSVTLAPMIHSHYLSCIYPALLLLMALGFEAGWQRGPKALAGLAAVALAVVTPAALARLYLEPHKTDWRGVAEWVGRRGGALPVYFYEDIGADPFDYYRPDQPQHRVTAPFGATGDAWRPVCTAMQQERGGFWLVLYLTGAGTREEESAIQAWLGRNFVVEEEAAFPPMRVWRCRPRGAAPATSPQQRNGTVP